ncbi:MAG: phytanoyl-CoA dioxygenase family protein [Janthinobacterium lividum]
MARSGVTTVDFKYADSPLQVPGFAVGEKEKTAFGSRGFVELRQVSPPDDLFAIRTRISGLFARRAGHEEGLFFDFAGSDDQTNKMRLPQLLDVRNFAPELTRTAFFRNASDIAKSLLGPDATFKADHALMKPSSDGAATPWHQDDAFRNLDSEYNEISIWLALQDTTRENGCMGFVPVSKGDEILPHRWVGGDRRIHALECYDGWSAEDVVWCPLSSGDCTVHTNRVLHGAGPNVSKQPRMAYVLVFGTPVKKPAVPVHHAWLKNKIEPRAERRQQWLRRGGIAIHVWRRFKQIPEIGILEMTNRVVLKVGKRLTHRNAG